eukprot:6436750-Pyramimonas_sp.AAC.1
MAQAGDEGASGHAERDEHLNEEHLYSQMFLFEHKPVSESQKESHCEEFAQFFVRFVERVRVAQMEEHDGKVSVHVLNTRMYIICVTYTYGLLYSPT